MDHMDHCFSYRYFWDKGIWTGYGPQFQMEVILGILINGLSNSTSQLNQQKQANIYIFNFTIRLEIDSK